ncbi:type ISP restriction/modification enzyme [Giesbergeria anulus]|uniref:site-specific DNA-methyltransferase (adenine-specific) n=1 Tax=Giesbergeria anulus TaxID=180197 RepID=A0A1H9MYS5_9BURK|nr:type ISP restriction/modification enzyme [Giesbergeria anulus]MBX9935999.1 N-6 DNA methylase [Burkholderiaceae bacterium]SER28565.1 Methyltransferase domain-containing protein [Giesbergeria anulus]
MSQHLIHDYLRQLDLIKKVSGSQRETIVREAFKDLLKAWGRQQGLVFLAEYPLKTAHKTNISVDGALLHELRMPLGYWEAKDADDKLDAEVSKKFAKGYPQDNILFSDDITAVLWQNRQEVLRCDMSAPAALEKLLKLFFGYERPEIAGFRSAVAQFKNDLPAVLQALRSMIDTAQSSHARFQQAAEKFLLHAQEAINPSLSAADVREMLIQHILTEEIFAKVFDDSDFHQHNNVARELYALESVFFTGALKKQTLKGLEPYYAAIRAAAAQIGSHSEKQTFLKVIYENFYKVYNTKAADRLGVVYTPNEIVRFMIEGADWLCEKYFSKHLIDAGVDILDPATGTGTYICELLEHFRGQPKKLAHKYAHELHANEVAILPYYVANLNIEATYAAITGDYAEFPSLCFVDTLDNVGQHTAAKGSTVEMFGSVSEENVARIQRQNSKHISVVIGNPPYNANQANENDNNKNREYQEIDRRIKETYIAESTAQKTKLYDMYARFFRWASDRLDDNGILAFVTNRSFIDARTFDGFRKTVAQEFSELYVVDLGGDVRANPKLSGTKHNVFGIQTGVAISFFVKRQRPAHEQRPARVFYSRRPEMETADDKLAWLARQPLRALELEEITPDKNANWVNLTDNDFEMLLPLASKETKAAKTAAGERAIFSLHSLGASTNRDDWVTDFSSSNLENKMKFFIQHYEKRVGYNSADEIIKWSETLLRRCKTNKSEVFNSTQIGKTLYRPFVSLDYYNSNIYIDRPGQSNVFFPINGKNPTICFMIGDRQPFSIISTGILPNLNMFSADAIQYAGFYQFDGIGNRIDNITDWALEQFNQHYAPILAQDSAARSISKQDIFHYCYAVLHNPAYREKYAQNLKREFPRIPFYTDFWRWADWGAQLVALHIGYEAVPPFALTRTDQPDTKARAAGLAPKAQLKADPTAGTITLDTETTLHGIPPTAWSYKLGNRSALDWVLDQYKERKPKDPTIREKFDTYRFADYKDKVIDLLARVTSVSVQTVAITEAMRASTR